MPLKYLGVGLSKTATKSLFAAMGGETGKEYRGFKSLHWDSESLRHVILGECNEPDFRRIYELYDFVCDIPHAYFFREIWQAYPGLKFILTERNEVDWYKSMCGHLPGKASESDVEKALHRLVYGAEFPKLQEGQPREGHLPEYLYKKRFRDWNRMIKCVIPEHLLLVLNICDNQKGESTEEKDKRLWRMLGDFVHPIEEPPNDKPFPRIKD
jgi:hypothetical protein